jgi:hypothetical protein
MMKKALLLFVSLMLLPLWLTAQPSACPKGKEALTCKSPCGRCVDKDCDGTCDLNLAVAGSRGSEAATSGTAGPANSVAMPSPYSPLAWSLLPLLAYALTSALSRSGRMRKQSHRYLWNAVLLVAFAISCCFGAILTCSLAYDWHLGEFYHWMLAWHVNAGIFMLAIGTVHTVRRFHYFLRLPHHGKND